MTLICLHIFYSFQLCKNPLICIATWTLENTTYDFSQDWRNTCTYIMKKHRTLSWKRLSQYLCICKRTINPLTKVTQSISVIIPVVLNKPRAADRNGVYLLFLALSLYTSDNFVLLFPKPIENSWAQPFLSVFLPFYFHYLQKKDGIALAHKYLLVRENSLGVKVCGRCKLNDSIRS